MKILWPVVAVTILLAFSKKSTPDNLSVYENSAFINHSVEGDFDGDGHKEKLAEFISDSTGNTISFEDIPDFEEWADYIDYIFKKGINTKIYIQGKKADTLDLGISMGVYCLINIGDNNNDKKDEIALVKDFPDYSRVNTCRIYSLCNNQWKELANFGIREDAFDYDTKKEPVFKEIADFLEFHNGKWMYKDYHDDEYDSVENVGKMKPLSVPKCR